MSVWEFVIDMRHVDMQGIPKVTSGVVVVDYLSSKNLKCAFAAKLSFVLGPGNPPNW